MTTTPQGDRAGTNDLSGLEGIASRIRNRVFEHVMANDGGYLSQAMSSADIFAALYGDVLQLGPVIGDKLPGDFSGVPGPANPDYRSGGRFNGERSASSDVFLFSPAHYALVLYAALIEADRLDPAALGDFNLDGSTMEMIGAEHSPGVETTTGSLAQALSQACGIALARKMRAESGRTWVFMSDGEFQEGQTWEALAFASFHRLGGLRAVVDANGQQCDGPMDGVGNVEPLKERIEAFGCCAVEVDGHDLAALVSAMNDPVDAPLVVVARTNPAHTLPVSQEQAPGHYLRFKSPDEQARYLAFYNDRMVTI